MTLNRIVETKKTYIPFDHKYSTSNDTSIDGFLEGKSSNITDRIIGLYQELYKRKEINTILIEEIESELIETSSELYQNKYNLFHSPNDKSTLERRIDLLEKGRHSEILEYWKDTSKLRLYLLSIVAEYRDFKNKKDLLK